MKKLKGQYNIDKLNKHIAESLGGSSQFIGFNKILCAICDNKLNNNLHNKKLHTILHGGVILSQIAYWSDRGARTDRYFFKSGDDWKSEIFLTPAQIRPWVKEFKEQGWVKTKRPKAKGAPTNHYFFDIEKFTNDLDIFMQTIKSENLTMDNAIIEQSLTKTTTENTTQNSFKDIGALPNNFQINKINNQTSIEIRLIVPMDEFRMVGQSVRDLPLLLNTYSGNRKLGEQTLEKVLLTLERWLQKGEILILENQFYERFISDEKIVFIKKESIELFLKKLRTINS